MITCFSVVWMYRFLSIRVFLYIFLLLWKGFLFIYELLAYWMNPQTHKVHKVQHIQHIHNILIILPWIHEYPCELKSEHRNNYCCLFRGFPMANNARRAQLLCWDSSSPFKCQIFKIVQIAWKLLGNSNISLNFQNLQFLLENLLNIWIHNFIQFRRQIRADP